MGTEDSFRLRRTFASEDSHLCVDLCLLFSCHRSLDSMSEDQVDFLLCQVLVLRRNASLELCEGSFELK
jgi:hypothetical protein